MTENFYRTETYKPDHSTFGGEIDLEDFNTNLPNKKRISNQINTINLMKKQREEQKLRKIKLQFTLKELKEMKLISNTNGRPLSYLTDEKWQKEFSLRKMFITPYKKDVEKLSGKYSKESGIWNEELQSTYHGCTNWQSYCSYINDILKNIRSGQVDYCYYIYQIEELVKFHYNTLRTRYRDGYWEVWLER